MRVVRTCDFCGDDATGIYEPLPASVSEGPRLLLCDPCRDRLASVVDPLVERIEGGEAGGDAAPAPDTSGGRDRWPDEEPAGGRDAPGREDREEGDATAGAAGGGDDAEAGRSGAEWGRDPGPDRPRGSTVNESRDASGRSQTDRAGTPHGYRKVMRFLENRELPMARSEAVQLSVDAYDLAEADVERCLDHAVQYGRLREVDGEIKR